MAKVGIDTKGLTMWECDRCEDLARSKNAFTLPRGWWQAVITRRTAGGKLKQGTIDACDKNCLMEAIQFRNQELVDYVK